MTVDPFAPVAGAASPVGAVTPDVFAVDKSLPPHDLYTEQRLIGTVVVFVRALEYCEGRVEPEDFYDEKNQRVWQSIEDVVAEGLDVSSDAIDAAHLKRYGSKPSVMLMIEATGQAVSWHNVKALVATLEDHSARRAMLVIGETISRKFDDPTIDPEDLREQVETELMERGASDDHATSSSMAEMLTDTLGEVDAAKARGGLLQGWKTGLFDWNKLLAEGGFVTGQHVLAAGTSQGKTALALKVALTVAHNGGTVLFFAMEMTKRSLMFRLLSLESGIDGWKLKRGQMSDDEWRSLSRSAAKLSLMQLHCVDKPGMSVAGVRGQCRRVRRQHGLDFVVVDYMQLMEGSKADTREQEVAKISRGLKGLSKDFDCPFLTLSQLSRSHEHRTGMDKEPRLSDLRESGAIEQDADSVTFIFMPHRYGLTAEDGGSLEAVAKILLRKQRDGALGEFWCSWNGPTMTFTDVYDGARVDPVTDQEPEESRQGQML